MAIVKTTNNQTNTSGSGPNGNGTTPEAKPVDRTKSVVNQGGAPVVRRPAPAVRSAASRGSVQTAPSSPRGFLEETRQELQKVVWPSRDDVQAGTIVTIGLLIVFGLYISGLDFLVERLFSAIGLLPK
jgi:preprotein translocase SecE subunit